MRPPHFDTSHLPPEGFRAGWLAGWLAPQADSHWLKRCLCVRKTAQMRCAHRLVCATMCAQTLTEAKARGGHFLKCSNFLLYGIASKANAQLASESSSQPACSEAMLLLVRSRVEQPNVHSGND